MDGIEKFCRACVVVNPYFQFQRAFLNADDSLIRELDIEGKLAFGDDFRGDIRIPRAFITTLQVPQITEQPPHEDVVLLVRLHQAVKCA